MADLSAAVPFTALDRDLWPLVEESERRAGIDATDDRGRRILVTVDALAQALTCLVVGPHGRPVGCYHLAARDLAAAFHTVHQLHRSSRT